MERNQLCGVIEMVVGTFKTQLVMLFVIYMAVLVMIFLDLWSGIRKAKQRGEYRSSYGLRKTGDKVARYFNVLMLMSVIDVLQIMFAYYLNQQINFHIPIIPVFTFGLAIFFGVIEIKSMYEKAEEKEKGKYQDGAKVLKKALTDKDAQAVFKDIMEYLSKENKNENK